MSVASRARCLRRNAFPEEEVKILTDARHPLSFVLVGSSCGVGVITEFHQFVVVDDAGQLREVNNIGDVLATA